MVKRPSLLSLLTLLFILTAALTLAATTVKPSNPDGWAPANVRANATVAITSVQPRDGNGSLMFTTNTITPGQDKADYEKIWGVVTGRTLSNLSGLSYEFFRDSSSTTAGHFVPVLRLYYLNASGQSGLLIWEPIYNGYGTVLTNTWVTTDIMDGNFWMRAFDPGRTIDDYNVSLAEWTANTDEEGSPIDDDADSDVPHVLGPDTYIVGVNVGVGSGWGATFRGYVDSVVVQFGTDEVSANFEPETPCTTICYVNNATGNDSFGGDTPTSAKKTIQAAVNQVNVAGQVIVAAGIYTEQVVITKSLTITGAGATSTTILAPATIPAASNPDSTIVKISGSSVNVEMSGFTVTGPGPTGCGSILAGIFVRDGANANIHDNRIIDIRDNPFSGCQNGIGILVGRAMFSTNGTANITSNVIEGYQKNGIVVSHIGSSGTISGNTITGLGPTTIIAQNGIQISSSATGVIINNTVTNHSYTPFSYVATGILLYEADANASGNTLSQNQVGLYHLEGSGVHDANLISGSATGTGSPYFWGMVIDAPPPGHQPWPFADTPTTTLDDTPVQAAAIQAVQVINNQFTGDGANAGIGLEADAGFGQMDIDLIATNNFIQNWGVGVLLTECASLLNCTGTTYTNIEVNRNSITGNLNGLDNASTFLVDATQNWWNSPTGPTHASNSGGTGDSASNNVTFTPWLCDGTDTSPAPGFQPNITSCSKYIYLPIINKN
jgi:hypothetical protein